MSKNTSTSNKTQNNHHEDNNGKNGLEKIADFEVPDGNCIKQVVEYFRNTTSMVPLVFYRDRMEMIRGNHEATIINKAVFDKTEFMIEYYVNESLFNDPGYIRTIKKPTGKMLPGGIPEMVEEKVADPRHIFIPMTETFHKQCKTIARRDGFRITIYKTPDAPSESKSRKMGELYQDSYMKASKISSNSPASGGIRVPGENVGDYKDYDFTFAEPIFGKRSRGIKLAELCNVCAGFVRHGCDITNLMCYPNGFRMRGGENQADQDMGWGKYKDEDTRKGKTKIVINDPNTRYNNFGVPKDFIKALSKLQTIASNSGIAACYSNTHCLEIVIPISVIGRLFITVIPPDDEDEEEEGKGKKVTDDDDDD